MNKTILKATLLLAAVLALPMSANAVLLGRDINGNAVVGNDVDAVFLYDDVLNVTWLRDANAGAGSAYDDIGINGGTTTDGQMTWAQANTWAANLVVGAYDDWRLPTLKPVNGASFNYNYTTNGTSDLGFGARATGWGTASEMGHLFYVTLGNNRDSFSNTGDFQNLQSYVYWSGLEVAPDFAWFFTFDGYQNAGEKTVSHNAFAVRPGDVLAPIPEPETYALMLAGLVVVGAVARWRKAK